MEAKKTKKNRAKDKKANKNLEKKLQRIKKKEEKSRYQTVRKKLCK